MQTQTQTQSNFPERRLRRSSIVEEALHYLAVAVATRVGLENVVIASDAGFVIGAAVEGEEAIALAAYAPTLADTTSTLDRNVLLEKLQEWVPSAGPNRLSVRRREFFGELFFLIALGDNIGRRDRALTDAIPAVGRIFGETWAE